MATVTGFGSELFGVAITPNGAFAYVTGFGVSVAVIDTATNTVVANVGVGVAIDPTAVAITADGSFAFVGTLQGSLVAVIDTATLVNYVPLGTIPRGLAVTPGGAFAYIAHFISNTVSVVDTATNTTLATVVVGRAPSGVAITPAP